VLLQAVPIAGDRSQARAVFGPNKDANGLSHAPIIAGFGPDVKHMFVSVH
jgi:hypothetical protein